MTPEIQTLIDEYTITFGLLGLYNPQKTAETSRSYANAVYKQVKRLVGKDVCVTVLSRIVNGQVKVSTSIG